MPDSIAYELVDGRLVERTVSEISSGVAMRIGYLLPSRDQEDKRRSRVWLGFNL